MDKLARGISEGWLLWVSIYKSKEVSNMSDKIQLWVLIARNRNDQVRRSKLVRFAEIAIYVHNIIIRINFNVFSAQGLILGWF